MEVMNQLNSTQLNSTKSNNIIADPLTEQEFKSALNSVDASKYGAKLGFYVPNYGERGTQDFGSSWALEATKGQSGVLADYTGIPKSVKLDLGIVGNNKEELAGYLQTLKSQSESGNKVATIYLNEAQKQLGLTKK
jgi:hypothetical protein